VFGDGFSSSTRGGVGHVYKIFNYYFVINIIIYLNCKWVFIRWQWYYNKTQHTNNTNNTPHSNNTTHKTTKTIKDTLTHNEYNSNTIPTTHK
jgi:hypothetical protein